MVEIQVSCVVLLQRSFFPLSPGSGVAVCMVQVVYGADGQVLGRGRSGQSGQAGPGKRGSVKNDDSAKKMRPHAHENVFLKMSNV